MPEVELSFRYTLIVPVLFLLFAVQQVSAQDAPPVPVVDQQNQQAILAMQTGDRVMSVLGPQLASADTANRASVRLAPDYRIGAGDSLTVRVRGKVDLHYGDTVLPANTTDQTQQSLPPETYEVEPGGLLNLPMLGPIEAAGRTVAELRQIVKDKLAEFYKSFDVDLSVSKPGVVKVWVIGQVDNPGPQSLASTSTILEALLRASIQASGSTRRVSLTRAGEPRTVDIYGVVAGGDLESNLVLLAGDQIYVPAASDWVEIAGQVSRPGRFEMVPPRGRKDTRFKLSDLMKLCEGALPDASLSHVVIQRPVANGEVTALHVDLSGKEDLELKPGDKVVVPSVADYQAIVRLVGEFKGEGVYQRVAGSVTNKSGVYRLARGETASDVITRTGGTTPQADYTRAKIERMKNGKLEVIPLNLDRLLTKQDKSADVVLESGDTIVLPALLDKVYVFGQVNRPGGYAFAPDRRLLEYIGQAGGLTGRSRTSIVIIRGGVDKQEVVKVDSSRSMQGVEKDNPIMEAGDVVYVPQKAISSWQDMAQIITTVKILTTF